MMRPVIHIVLHFLFPALVARLVFIKDRFKIWLIMVATLLIDLDHLLADPVYDPTRCSLGFHPLHTWPAVLFYAGLLFPKRTRIIGVGLLIHILLDLLDCIWMSI